jgi:hypothetical protein
MAEKTGAEAAVREIRRQTRRRYSAEEKIRIVLEGLLIALAAAAASGATPVGAAPLYTIVFNYNPGGVSSYTPFRRDTVNAIPTSNGSGTFTGSAFAGPGQVVATTRLDAIWDNGLSGGNGGHTRCVASTNDFVISGPSAPSVTGIMHFRVTLDHELAGGFPDNNAHDAQCYVRASVGGLAYWGQSLSGNYSTYGTDLLAGQTTPHMDVPFAVGGDFPVGTPMTVELQLEAWGGTYGNVFHSPGYIVADAGAGGGDPSNGGLRLEEVSGQVMTLPAGYTLNSPTWNVVDNHFLPALDVEPVAPAPELALRLGANPWTGGEERVVLTMPRGGRARVEVFDIGGRRVRVLASGWQSGGEHSLDWDGRDQAGGLVSRGIYFVMARAEGRQVTQRLVRIR